MWVKSRFLWCHVFWQLTGKITKSSYFGALTYCDKEQLVEAKAPTWFSERQIVHQMGAMHDPAYAIFIPRGGGRDDTQQALAAGE